MHPNLELLPPSALPIPHRALRRLAAGALLAACGTLSGVAAAPDAARAEPPPARAAVAQAAPERSTPRVPAGGSTRARDPRDATRPAWRDLTPVQQQALSPLASGWPTLSEAQKRKWIALSRNFGALPPAEQATLHSRMAEWVALSPQQRAQARLNFGEARRLPTEDKKAMWEAYQQLSPEEKRKLAAGAPARPPAAAAAVRPVPARKLANVPKSPGDAKPPRIAVGPPDAPEPPGIEPGGATLLPRN